MLKYIIFYALLGMISMAQTFEIKMLCFINKNQCSFQILDLQYKKKLFNFSGRIWFDNFVVKYTRSLCIRKNKFNTRNYFDNNKNIKSRL